MARLSKSQRELLAKATENYEGSLGEALPYLASRGIAEATARMFRLGFVANPEAGHEPYLGKLAIPYLTPSGVIDIRFRSLNNDSGPKYLSRPGASTHIYNVQALNDDTDFLVICEGELDTIIATQVGFSAKTITRELDNVFPVFMPDNQDVNDVFLAEGAEGLRKRVGV